MQDKSTSWSGWNENLCSGYSLLALWKKVVLECFFFEFPPTNSLYNSHIYAQIQFFQIYNNKKTWIEVIWPMESNFKSF